MKRTLKKRRSFSKAWLFIVLLLIFFSLGVFFLLQLYFGTLENKERQFKESRSYVLSNNLLEEITSMEAFHELDSYHIFFGKDKEGEDLIVFLPLEAKDRQVVLLNKQDILNEDKIYERNFKTCTSCRNITIHPAMINEHPLWEVTYYDQHNRYNLDYFSMLDGSRYERLQLKQTFK